MNTTLNRLTTALSDRYRIERELGSGGMATVNLAGALKHHRQVAIKCSVPTSKGLLPVESLQSVGPTKNDGSPIILI